MLSFLSSPLVTKFHEPAAFSSPPDLMADPTRENEIKWSELVDQRIDMTETNEEWLAKFKKAYDLQ